MTSLLDKTVLIIVLVGSFSLIQEIDRLSLSWRFPLQISLSDSVYIDLE